MTGLAKFDGISGDFRIASVRLATAEESEGEAGWVMVLLAEGCNYRGSNRLIAHGVGDLRALLATVDMSDE